MDVVMNLASNLKGPLVQVWRWVVPKYDGRSWSYWGGPACCWPASRLWVSLPSIEFCIMSYKHLPDLTWAWISSSNLGMCRWRVSIGLCLFSGNLSASQLESSACNLEIELQARRVMVIVSVLDTWVLLIWHCIWPGQSQYKGKLEQHMFPYLDLGHSCS